MVWFNDINTRDSLKLICGFVCVNRLGGVDQFEQIDEELCELVSSFLCYGWKYMSFSGVSKFGEALWVWVGWMAGWWEVFSMKERNLFFWVD